MSKRVNLWKIVKWVVIMVPIIWVGWYVVSFYVEYGSREGFDYVVTEYMDYSNYGLGNYEVFEDGEYVNEKQKVKGKLKAGDVVWSDGETDDYRRIDIDGEYYYFPKNKLGNSPLNMFMDSTLFCADGMFYDILVYYYDSKGTQRKTYVAVKQALDGTWYLASGHGTECYWTRKLPYVGFDHRNSPENPAEFESKYGHGFKADTFIWIKLKEEENGEDYYEVKTDDYFFRYRNEFDDRTSLPF